MDNIKNILCILFFISTTLWADETKISFATQSDLDFGSYQGQATLSVKKSQIEIGRKFIVDIRFTNKGMGDDFYNLGFNKLIPLPAMLAIYNDKKEYIGNLLFIRNYISKRSVEDNDWQYVPCNCYLGTSLRCKIGNQYSPGEYYLQMIYYKSFISNKPEQLSSLLPSVIEKGQQEFNKKFDRNELFRSNIVQIRLVKKDPNKKNAANR